MTRLEITDKAKNYEGDKLSFEDGAEWMQTRMIEKAYLSYCKAWCHECNYTNCKKLCQGFIKFKQAMES